MPFLDKPFRIPRYMLARLAAEQYLRSFWWFVIIPPLFGFVCLFSGSQVLYALGVFGILWPATVPARAVLISRKAGLFFEKPTWVHLNDYTLYFSHESGPGMKLSLSSVRRIDERHGYLILTYHIGEFVAIPADVSPSLQELIDEAEAARLPERQEASSAS